MRQHVRVGMPEQTFFKRNLHAAENQLSPFDEPVGIEPGAKVRVGCQRELPVLSGGEFLVDGFSGYKHKVRNVPRRKIQRAIVRRFC